MLEWGDLMGTEGIYIRETEAGDLQEIEDVLLDAYGQYSQFLSQEHWTGYRDDILRQARESGAWRKFLAVSEEQIVGSVFLYGPSLTAEDVENGRAGAPFVRLLAVRPSARGKGVATALIQECARVSAAEGKDFLYLNTSDMMADAVRLYEQLGFVRVPEYETYKVGILVKCYKLDLQTTSLLHA
ncbi:GNAT family N-acetyltransferase [Cohnella abietis]|uniref:N-acetyltransferase domain-containing protein n=1 Tax=Cohnella abietis TaxID=2507935 RepID=A0A3T1DBP2_9BACL|nr:GNAT family N-acetyltransferase [Cohnella abietis]BBI35551.1 hypothetical protein KCTCHS21_49500 [Cohnella abietis]